VVFAGTFTAGGLQIALDEGRLTIAQEGQARKFHKAVQQVTFSGAHAAAARKPVLFVTERAVFDLCPQGLRLIEIAPGADLDRDILAQMDFHPVIEDVIEMDARIFTTAPMNLKAELLHLDLEDRFALDPAQGLLFINFEKLRIRSQDDLTRIQAQVITLCQPLDARVDVIVNYDGTRIDEDIAPAYTAMVNALEDQFYARVTRYSSSAFMRMKLGRAFTRDHAPHIFETAEEARRYLKS